MQIGVLSSCNDSNTENMISLSDTVDPDSFHQLRIAEGTKQRCNVIIFRLFSFSNYFIFSCFLLFHVFFIFLCFFSFFTSFPFSIFPFFHFVMFPLFFVFFVCFFSFWVLPCFFSFSLHSGAPPKTSLFPVKSLFLGTILGERRRRKKEEERRTG